MRSQKIKILVSCVALATVGMLSGCGDTIHYGGGTTGGGTTGGTTGGGTTPVSRLTFNALASMSTTPEGISRASAPLVLPRSDNYGDFFAGNGDTAGTGQVAVYDNNAGGLDLRIAFGAGRALKDSIRVSYGGSNYILTTGERNSQYLLDSSDALQSVVDFGNNLSSLAQANRRAIDAFYTGNESGSMVSPLISVIEPGVGISLYRSNSGNPTLQQQVSDTLAGSALAHGDENGDGLQDLYYLRPANDNNVVMMYHADTANPGSISGDYRELSTTFRGVATSLGVADFDNDGNPDIVVGSTGTDSSVSNLAIFWAGSARDYATTTSANSSDRVLALKVVDLDGDGDLDIAFLHTSGSSYAVSGFFNEGSQTFALERLFNITGVSQVDGFDVGHLNGDNKLDFVVGAGGELLIATQN